jgi:hypothetical protein
MKYLTKPAPAKDDLAVVKSICKKNGLAKEQSDWIRAYVKYYLSKGNPWSVSPSTYSKPFSDQQYKLYDSRKSGGPIKRIRATRNLLSCPVCGSSTTGDVDHYLPRKVYPEFSIMRANLVPSCTHCNSSVKGSHVKGEKPQRFIHPYFDDWADKAIWHIEFVVPFEAVQFRPTPNGKLSEDRQKIVDFHLNHVLGEQFHRSMENKWATLPNLLNLTVRSSKKSYDHTHKAIRGELRKAKATTGKNSWDTAFFRGLLKNSSAIGYIHDLRLTKSKPFPE